MYNRPRSDVREELQQNHSLESIKIDNLAPSNNASLQLLL
jgi:hypothetical protein